LEERGGEKTGAGQGPANQSMEKFPNLRSKKRAAKLWRKIQKKLVESIQDSQFMVRMAKKKKKPNEDK